MLKRERRILDILSLKKKLNCWQIPGVHDGKGEDALRVSNSFTVYQRYLGFSKDDETR